MTSPHHHIRLAQSLPPRLLTFLAKHPPSALPKTLSATTTLLPPSGDEPNSASQQNPFTRTKHPISHKYHPPPYSLRRQADLIKLAHQHKIADLLPPTTKDPEVRDRRRAEEGLRVKGTGVGSAVKGKKWERTMKGRLERRRQAMLGMPRMVQEWKQLGHGRGWKKWPR